MSASGNGSQLRRRAGGKAVAGKPMGDSNVRGVRLITEESAGLKVEPVVVLILSIIFIGSVFALHIIGKFVRG